MNTIKSFDSNEAVEEAVVVLKIVIEDGNDIWVHDPVSWLSSDDRVAVYPRGPRDTAAGGDVLPFSSAKDFVRRVANRRYDGGEMSDAALTLLGKVWSARTDQELEAAIPSSWEDCSPEQQELLIELGVSEDDKIHDALCNMESDSNLCVDVDYLSYDVLPVQMDRSSFVYVIYHRDAKALATSIATRYEWIASGHGYICKIKAMIGNNVIYESERTSFLDPKPEEFMRTDPMDEVISGLLRDFDLSQLRVIGPPLEPSDWVTQSKIGSAWILAGTDYDQGAAGLGTCESCETPRFADNDTL